MRQFGAERNEGASASISAVGATLVRHGAICSRLGDLAFIRSLMMSTAATDAQNSFIGPLEPIAHQHHTQLAAPIAHSSFTAASNRYSRKCATTHFA